MVDGSPKARNELEIAQKENFGPVLTAIPFKNKAEALHIANDVDHGLAACLRTNDLSHTLRTHDRCGPPAPGVWFEHGFLFEGGGGCGTLIPGIAGCSVKDAGASPVAMVRRTNGATTATPGIFPAR